MAARISAAETWGDLSAGAKDDSLVSTPPRFAVIAALVR